MWVVISGIWMARSFRCTFFFFFNLSSELLALQPWFFPICGICSFTICCTWQLIQEIVVWSSTVICYYCYMYNVCITLLYVIYILNIIGYTIISERTYYWNIRNLTAKTIDKKWAIKALLIPPGKIKAHYSYWVYLEHSTSLLTERKTRSPKKISNVNKLINIYFKWRHLEKQQQ